MKFSRVATIGLLAVSGTLAGCQFTPSAASAAEPAAPPQATPAVAPTPALSPVERYRLGFRLRPDARFVQAAARIHHFYTGEPLERCALRFEQGRWQLLYREETVASLPELAGFQESLDALSGFAKQLSQDRRTAGEPVAPKRLDEIRAAVDEVSPPSLLSALDTIQQQWEPEQADPRLLELAARATVRLVLQSRDDLQLSDGPAAAAVAAVALARAGGGRNGADEALLAEQLGYRSEALELARQLDPDDPVRLFLQGDSNALQRASRKAPADRFTRFLAMQDLARRGEVDKWASWAESLLRDPGTKLGVAASALELRGFDANVAVAEYALESVLLEAARLGGDADWRDRLAASAAGRLDQLVGDGWALERQLFNFQTTHPLSTFESRLQELPFQAGPWWGREELRDYWRGLLYSGLFRLSRHYLEPLGSIRASRDLVRVLGRVEEGVASDFRDWLATQADALEGKTTPAELWSGLARFQALGHPLRHMTFQRLAETSPYGDPTVSLGARLLTAAMDSRVEHRRQLASIAFSNLRDLALTEKLLLSAGRADPSLAHTAPWHAYFVDDDAALIRLARSPLQSPETRETALALALRGNLLTPADAVAVHRELVGAHPRQWARYEAAIKNLEEAGEYSEALRTARLWLRVNGDREAFPFLFARADAARMLQKLGRPAEGLPLVEPLVRSMQAGVLNRTALILSDLGRDADAHRVARSLLSRYPQLPFAYACMARVLWQGGRPDEAADVLGRASRFSATEWQKTMGTAFAESFVDRPEAAREAFAALTATSVPRWLLEQLVVPVDRAGRHRLAFELQSMLRPTANPGSLSLPVRAYVYLERAEGRGKAQAWLRQTLSPGQLNPASMWIFREGRYPLLWDLIEDPDSGDGGEFVWLLRAAAVRLDAASAHRRQQVAERLRTGGEGVHWDLARYLLGMVGEQDVLRHATTTRRECEIAYFMGLEAMAGGRYPEASDWFQVVQQTGQQQAIEYRLALDQLYRWAGEGKRLTWHADPARDSG